MGDVLNIKDINVCVDRGEVEGVDILTNVNLNIEKGETVCLVGESGSGKTVLAKTIMRLIDYENAEISTGDILFQGTSLVAKSAKEMQRIRGKEIAMIFQEPMTAFDPVFPIGKQIVESIYTHETVSKREGKARALRLLEQVKLPDPTQHFYQYPNELSGGMLQRAMIAMALSCNPTLLIADEPTTALDVTIQAEIMALLQEVKAEYGMTLLMVTHDLNLAAEAADRIIVMYAGEVVEIADSKTLTRQAFHPYSVGLLKASAVAETDPAHALETIGGSIPDIKNVPNGCKFHERCAFATSLCECEAPPLSERGDGRSVACWHVDKVLASTEGNTVTSFRAAEATRTEKTKLLFSTDSISKDYKLRRRKGRLLRAVDSVDLEIYEGETFGLVGESGSGKSTFGKMLLQLERQTAGEVTYDDVLLHKLKRKTLRGYRKDLQVIFQDPYASLDPRWKAAEIIGEPLALHLGLRGKPLREEVERLLEQVGLNPAWGSRYPHQFSGGQRQRINIARAISTKPRFIVADEAVSALDVAVQAQIINLLKDLQRELNLTYLFISHDLGVVKYISDRIGVMKSGRLIEVADRSEIFNNPKHEYTKKLIESIPQPV